MDEKRITHLMQALNINRAEAIQVIEDDKRIDKGEKLFELSPELEAGAKKARQAERKPTAYKFQKRERKAKPDKQFLIEQLVASVTEHADAPPEVQNAEREFTFTMQGTKYKVVLSCPRS